MEAHSKTLEVIQGGLLPAQRRQRIVDFLRTHGGALLRQQGCSAFDPDAMSAQELSPAERRAIGIANAHAPEPHPSVRTLGVKLRLATP